MSSPGLLVKQPWSLSVDEITSIAVPQMTTAERDNLVSPPNGTVIYNTTAAQFQARQADGWGVLAWNDLFISPAGVGAKNNAAAFSVFTSFSPTSAIGPTCAFYNDVDISLPTAGQSISGNYTLFTTTTATSGTHPVVSAMHLYPPVITDLGATTTIGATLYVEAGPSVGASQYAVCVDAGLSRFDGDGTHIFELPANAVDPTGGGGAAAGRIPIKVGGATKYLAYY